MLSEHDLLTTQPENKGRNEPNNTNMPIYRSYIINAFFPGFLGFSNYRLSYTYSR